MTLAAGQPSTPTPPPSATELRAAAGSALARRLSPKYLEQHCLLPLERPEGVITILAGTPLDVTVLDELCWTFGQRITVVDVPAAEIQAAIMAAHAESGMDLQAGDLRGSEIEVLAPEEERIDDLRALATQAPVIKLVNVLMLEALKARASDIHLEPSGEGLRVRYRIDGVLHDAARPPKQYQAAIVSRVKIMADLNIAERRLAQDGRIRLRLADREVDLRVSTVPALHGEGVVLRILDRGGEVQDLDALGMSGDALARFDRLLRQPHGIILVTGPTGSGKTTTLYAGLRRINEPGVKIITVEDPVEYQVAGVTQIPVNAKVGLTFAAALRSILRHDPDVIMVGEMRDAETATIAIQAALTGHLVFSTLHTNDAPGGITRLVDMGVEPYLVAATVQGILAQRLVRVVCEQCAAPDEPSAKDLDAASHEGLRIRRPTFRRGSGCDACAGTGYRGRTGIYELLVLSDGIRERVVHGASLDEIRGHARREGLVPLRATGWAKACEGVTTVAEILRVTRDDTL